MRGFRHQAGIILSTVFWAGFFLLFSAQIFRAELLPIKTYFSTDGLIYDKIYRIYQDSRGFVWFSTPAGISRFDGYQFLSYGLENGLAENSMITDSVEDENGVYWFSTSASGVYRFDPRPPAAAENKTAAVHFEQISISDAPGANSVRRMYKTRKNEILVGANNDLYRLVPGENRFERVDLNLGGGPGKPGLAVAFGEDADGSLWIGHQYGLTRRLPSGEFVTYEILPQPNGTDRVLSLA